MHHGFANGVAISYAMAFNQSVAAERLADLAVLVGASEASPAGFIRWLEELKLAIGIPRTLSEAGVKAEHLDALVNVAVRDACHPNNPRAVSEGDFQELFRAALG
jgi:alcohol dehydrogenase class IV